MKITKALEEVSKIHAEIETTKLELRAIAPVQFEKLQSLEKALEDTRSKVLAQASTFKKHTSFLSTLHRLLFVKTEKLDEQKVKDLAQKAGIDYNTLVTKSGYWQIRKLK